MNGEFQSTWIVTLTFFIFPLIVVGYAGFMGAALVAACLLPLIPYNKKEV